MRNCALGVGDPAVSASHWRCEVDDPLNPSGCLEFGRLVMARGFQPESNMTYGCSLGVQDESTIVALEDGGEDAQVRTPRVVASFSLDFLSKTEAYSLVLNMQRTLGVWGEVLVCLDPTDATYLHRNTIWGRFRQLSPITHQDCVRWACPFDIVQIVR